MTSEPVYLYAGFLDVLAYRSHLESDRKKGVLEFQKRISDSLSILNQINESIFRIQAISDSIVITCRDHDKLNEFIRILRDVFINFMKNGLFVRGGVAYSRHFQNGSVTYSHAIALAYELESTIAQYPRIVIDKNIIDMLANQSGGFDNLESNLLCVENNVYFINILSKENWGEIHEYAKSIYYCDKSEDRLSEQALNKHIRFERYLFAYKFLDNTKLRFIEEFTYK